MHKLNILIAEIKETNTLISNFPVRVHLIQKHQSQPLKCNLLNHCLSLTIFQDTV